MVSKTVLLPLYGVEKCVIDSVWTSEHIRRRRRVRGRVVRAERVNALPVRVPASDRALLQKAVKVGLQGCILRTHENSWIMNSNNVEQDESA